MAQICSHFEKVSSAAVDTLAEILSRFLNEVGQLSRRQTEAAGRTGVNIGDVLCTLKSMHVPLVSCLHDFKNFDVPFAHALPPRLHVRRMPKRAPSSRELGSVYCEHVPTFLPAVPDQHTLKSSPASENLVKMPDYVAIAKSNKRSRFIEGCKKMSTSAGKYGQKHVMTGESSNSRRRGRMKALSSTLQDQYKAADHQNSSDEMNSVGMTSGTRRKKRNTSAIEMIPFREGSTMVHADHDTVEKLVRGQISVFENA